MAAPTRSLELMFDCLSPSRLEEACLAFSDRGAPVPSVIWSPKPHQLMHPLIDRFWHICSGLCRDDGLFHATDLRLADFETLADWTMVVRIEPASGTLTYAHYGKGIADHFGSDMTGLTTDHFGGHISQFFNATYREVSRRKEWVLTEHEPPKQVFVCSWRRLLLPLIGAENNVTGFLAINVPESPLRAGLDLVPEPLFVLDACGSVRFANTFARTLFGIHATVSKEVSFAEVTGIELKPPDAPEEMFARTIVDNRVERLRVGDRLEDDFLITISGAIHSGNAYYIVMLRLLLAQGSSAVPKFE